MTWPRDRTCAVCRAIHAAYGFMRRSPDGGLERIVVCPDHRSAGRAWHQAAGVPCPWLTPAPAPAILAPRAAPARIGEQGRLL